jgi:hypothetical protein
MEKITDELHNKVAEAQEREAEGEEGAAQEVEDLLAELTYRESLNEG